MESFGSAAMALAGLGSLMTRRPLTNALNAGAAVMQAYHKNDMEAAQQAYQKWEVETKNAMAMHQFEQEAYRNAIDKSRNNVEQLRANLTGLAASFKDDAALAMLNSGDTQGALALITGRGSLGGRMGSARDRLADERKDFVDLQAARKAYREAEAKGDPDAMAVAQGQIDDIRQRAQDRSYVHDPVKSEKPEKPGDTLKKRQLEALDELETARESGDADAIKKAEQKLLAIKGKVETPADKLKQEQVDAIDALRAARESGDADAIKKAEQNLRDVGKGGGADKGLTPNRLIAQSAQGYAASEIDRLTKDGKPPTAEQKAEITMAALRRAETEAPLTPAQQSQIELKIGQATRAGKMLKELQDEINRRGGLSGLTGTLRRGAENVEALFGGNSVEANAFKNKLDELKGLVGTAMSPSTGRPLAADVKRTDEVLSNVGWGKSAALLARALHEAENMLYQQQQIDERRLKRERVYDFVPKSLPPYGKQGAKPTDGAAPASFDDYRPTPGTRF